MGNMSYCRFENIYNDLQDCYEHIGDDLSGSEARYRKHLIKLCEDILAEAEYLDNEDDEE